MTTIITQQGRRIEIIYQSELCDPINMGEYVRAYCHIHGSDHQRSLSINKETGWGHCFNATCDATVLVAEWNPRVAQYFLYIHAQGPAPSSSPSSQPTKKKPPHIYQPMLLHPLKAPPKWQQDELSILLSLEEQMRAALAESQRAHMYLEERGIPIVDAIDAGVCYLSPSLPNGAAVQKKKRRLLQRWIDRIIFPLASPDGKGYIGRSLWRWRPGMDENAHKTLLERPDAPRRWIKTNPAGWFGYDPDQLTECIVLVEGAFDRLTLLSAGMGAADVIALAGTATHADWFPSQVKTVVLALDADEGGREATQRLAEQLEKSGFTVKVCPSFQDTYGKDWNERWRRIGPQSVQPIFEAYSALKSA